MKIDVLVRETARRKALEHAYERWILRSYEASAAMSLVRGLEEKPKRSTERGSGVRVTGTIRNPYLRPKSQRWVLPGHVPRGNRLAAHKGDRVACPQERDRLITWPSFDDVRDFVASRSVDGV